MTDNPPPMMAYNVIRLNSKRKAAVKTILRPQITLYENNTMDAYIPDIDDTPAARRSIARLLRDLADMVEAPTKDTP